MNPQTLSNILKTGLIVGTLDILSAFTHYYLRTGKSPINVLTFVASGVFGKEAFLGSMAMPYWGLFFHFTIAMVWTVVFYFLSPVLKTIGGSNLILGGCYGVFIWSIMNFGVLPLSNTPKIPFNPGQSMIGMLIIVFAVGIPIALRLGK
jgi:uncharacterized membrane protein YagU involved in acid resistance